MARREGKGTYGRAKLPLADRYLVPWARHRKLLVVATALAVLVVGAALADYFLGGGRRLSSGPLASAHAAFEEDCSNCHSAAERSAEPARCSACHEKVGDELGVYSYASHYLYRSDDFRRVVPSEHEVACFACHPDHGGRSAALTRVGDVRCRACHFGSFDDHPELEFERQAIPDDDALAFPHGHHVREVLKETGGEDLERACLYCHNARADGRGFEPLDFDRHCDPCHLTAGTGTPALPVGDPGDAAAPGVATLESILETRGAAARWALYVSPGEFRRRGAAVSKTPVEHRDPWILDNLRSLRRTLYPDAGLADLLVASPEAPPHRVRELYEEAIRTLEDQVLGLRGSADPAIRAEIEALDVLLEGLRRRVRQPFAPLDESRLELSLAGRNEALSDDEAQAILALADDLTEPCRRCHQLDRATIRRVDEDQRVLRRAEFDHRAHIVQRRCLDCHARIPIAELAAADKPLDPEADRAAIQNLPSLAVCRECHNPRLASDRCITCHRFHPDTSRRSHLLLYLEPAGGSDAG